MAIRKTSIHMLEAVRLMNEADEIQVHFPDVTEENAENAETARKLFQAIRASGQRTMLIAQAYSAILGDPDISPDEKTEFCHAVLPDFEATLRALEETHSRLAGDDDSES